MAPPAATLSAPPLAADATPTQRMLHGPVVATLLRLAAPNVVGLFASTVVIGYDGFILGRLGADALAGVALVLPLAMLMLQMSAGGLGGATTGAVARALGGGDRLLAAALAQHALMLAVAASLLFTVVGSSDLLYAAMGGSGGALEEARTYATVLFGGAALVWCCNVLAGIVRGTGEMLVAALALLATTVIHLVLCPVLVFGWGPVPAMGVAGAAASTLVSNAAAAAGMALWLAFGANGLRLRAPQWVPRTDHFRRILRVGLPAAVNPLLSNASIATATAWVAAFGPAAVAAYGIAARLEYILVPIAFGMGSALTAMVATNLGAGQVARARQVAWVGAGFVLGVTGAIGLAAAIWPFAWMGLFTADPAICDTGAAYLRIAGASYGFFGLGLALFFASQGTGRVGWALVASSTRLAVVVVGGWIAVRWLGGSIQALSAVVALSLVALALTLAAATHWSRWQT